MPSKKNLARMNAFDIDTHDDIDPLTTELALTSSKDSIAALPILSLIHL